MLNEASLVKRLRAKDDIAFQGLINEFGPRLLRGAKLLIANEQEAEELVCDTFANAFLSIKKFRQESSLFTWLYRILLNEFYHRSRRRKREVVSESVLQQVTQAMVVSEPDQRTLVLFRQYVSDLLNRISADHREVLLLKYLEGMKVKEIARVLKISENTIKTRLHRALNNLRKILEQGNLLPE